jgi:hypothetical protein
MIYLRYLFALKGTKHAAALQVLVVIELPVLPHTIRKQLLVYQQQLRRIKPARCGTFSTNVAGVH